MQFLLRNTPAGAGEEPACGSPAFLIVAAFACRAEVIQDEGG